MLILWCSIRKACGDHDCEKEAEDEQEGYQRQVV